MRNIIQLAVLAIVFAAAYPSQVLDFVSVTLDSMSQLGAAPSFGVSVISDAAASSGVSGP